MSSAKKSEYKTLNPYNKMTEELIYPTINLNGQDKDKLQAQYQEGLDKIRDAIEAIKGIDLHGRDYLRRNDFPKAHKQFLHRVVIPLNTAEEYLEDVTINISQQ
tara:strand:- start:11068 stop:11379 length:312 start_codon:yes stop_codon:yes gene_type:complete